MWKNFEVEFLKETTESIPEISTKLERSPEAIYRMMKRRGINNVSGLIASQVRVYQIKRRRVLPQYRELLSFVDRWSRTDLALFFIKTNEQIAEITGFSLEEVGDRRLLWNLQRNGWLHKDPEK